MFPSLGASTRMREIKVLVRKSLGLVIPPTLAIQFLVEWEPISRFNQKNFQEEGLLSFQLKRGQDVAVLPLDLVLPSYFISFLQMDISPFLTLSQMAFGHVVP